MSRKIFLPVEAKPPMNDTNKPASTRVESDKPTEDIDELMRRGLLNISRMMAAISTECERNSFNRETVQNLKDLINMLSELKKREAELLDRLTDEDLRKIAE